MGNGRDVMYVCMYYISYPFLLFQDERAGAGRCLGVVPPTAMEVSIQFKL
jgi:hypothetical protein